MYCTKSGIVLLTILLFSISCLNAKDSPEIELYIKQNVAPEQLYKNLINNPALRNNPDGEPFAWNACSGGDLFVKGYLAWKDTLWLSYAIKYYDFLLEHMSEAPDGYLGLIGRNYRKGGDLINEEVSDGLVFNLILEFCELVLGDEHLRATYGEKANSYVAFVKRNVVEKWLSRGLWIEIGEYGDYAFGNDYINPENREEWLYDSIEPGMSQKFNIAGKLGLCNLYL